MKKLCLSVLALACLSAAALADEPKMSAEEQKAMEMWMKLATPSESHKELEAMAGTWDTAVKMWMAPDAPPAESKGVSVNKMVLGGRWLEQSFKGEMMGGPFEGIGYTGYDNYKKQYVGWWMDTMSTMAMQSTGTADDKANTMTLTASMDEPISGGTTQVKEVITVVDADHHTFEMWMTDPKSGQMMKSMEIAYTRKK